MAVTPLHPAQKVSQETPAGPACMSIGSPRVSNSSGPNASPGPESTTSSNCASHPISRPSEPPISPPKLPLELDAYIESHLRHRLFHYPKFVDHFLSGSQNTLSIVLKHCQANSNYNGESNQWILPETSSETSLHGPIRNILDTIASGVHHARTLCSPASPKVSGIAALQDYSSRSILSDDPETTGLKPDLVLFEGPHEHWETVRLPIEIMQLTTHHKAGMKQLARYAKAVFAHQLHRRHLFSLMVCGTEATFVRFDRAGVLYSPRLDMRHDAEGFARAFAALLLLDRGEEGYDRSFTTMLDENGRFEYYVDLPSPTAESRETVPTQSAGPQNTTRFKVFETLCHRKDICDRATIVLRIREDTPEITTGSKRKHQEVGRPEPQDYVLKMIWRDPKESSEGEMLQRVQGTFGVAQCVWHCDMARGPKGGPDETIQVDGLEVCDSLQDLAIRVPIEADGGEPPDLASVDTTLCRPTTTTRARRIYSYVLLSSIGKPIREAESPRQFMTAMLDSILGCWGLFNLGILHRDISEGNVMILVSRRRSRSEGRTRPDHQVTIAPDEQLAKSRARLEEVLNELDREPTGVLSDFDLSVSHSFFSQPIETVQISSPDASDETAVGSDDLEPDAKCRKVGSKGSTVVPAPETTPTVVHRESKKPTALPEPSQKQEKRSRVLDYRTGTFPFMSIRVLDVYRGEKYEHTFLDDLESFFWLMLYSIAGHADPGSSPTGEAQHVMTLMNGNFYNWDGSHRLGRLLRFRRAQEFTDMLTRFDNEWASDRMLAKVLFNLGKYFLRFYTDDGPSSAPADVFSSVVQIIRDGLAIEE